MVFPGRILVDFSFLVVAGKAAVPVPPTKSPWGTIGGAGEAGEALLPALPGLPVESSDVFNGASARVLVTDGGWWPLLAAETSMFSVSETEFGSISWLCTYIERYQLSDEFNIYLSCSRGIC